MRKKITLFQGCVIFLLIYAVLAVSVYYIGGEQFYYSASTEIKGTGGSTSTTGEILDHTKVTQTFTAQKQEIQCVSVFFSTGGKQNPGEVKVRLLSSGGDALTEKEISLSALADNAATTITFDSPVHVKKGSMLTLELSVPGASAGKSAAVWYDAKTTFSGGGEWCLNGAKQNGVLCVSYTGRDPIGFGKNYAKIMSGIGLLLMLYCLNLIFRQKKGKSSLGLNLLNAFSKYHFLLNQLVSRDFKTKYKRSVLGVFWSFLNPLLAMSVQYVVFSTIFKSNIENFPVYLLTGIVFFNFFTEATSMGLGAIVGNAPLITKVYIPKYIFPVSRVLSSAINLLISLVPLFLVMAITGTAFRPALLLLPFSIICTLLFCFGMCFLLSSAMVFFRDMQFLWSVLIMLWMYATPLFYPESILPAKYMFVFKLNPMYHFIRFSRAIIIDGVSPEPKTYLFCLIAAIVPLFIGGIVFKKTQNKFILSL